MMEIGRMCVKIAGRDAGKKGAIVEIIDSNFVIIDGQMKKGKANIRHIEPLQHKLDIATGASHEAVVEALKQAGVDFPVKKTFVRKPKSAKASTAAEKPAAKKAEKVAKAAAKAKA